MLRYAEKDVRSDEGMVIRRSATVVASATSDRAIRFAVTHAGPELPLTYSSRSRHEAHLDGRVVGSIRLVGWAGRRVEADLPETLPVEVRPPASFMPLRSWNLRAHN